MSTELETIDKTGADGTELQITQYWGGNEKGCMLQVSQGLSGRIHQPGFIQLTRRDAILLKIRLDKWVKEVKEEEKKQRGCER